MEINNPYKYLQNKRCYTYSGNNRYKRCMLDCLEIKKNNVDLILSTLQSLLLFRNGMCVFRLAYSILYDFKLSVCRDLNVLNTEAVQVSTLRRVKSSFPVNSEL